MHLHFYQYRIWIIFLIILNVGCTEKRKIKSSYYHWQLEVSDTQNKAPEWAKGISKERIFLHILDLDYDNSKMKINPVSILNAQDSFYLLSEKIVPVIYIVNEALLEVNENELLQLAKKIVQAKQSFNLKIKNNSNLELQIDCDWTLKTKEKYFNLLKAIKKEHPQLIVSSTIRLYPYKYKQRMGVPPVDYGVLMCYNMDKIKNYETPNSIFNLDVLNQYLPKRNDYPIPLIPALPIYGWSVWFQDNNYKSILYINPKDNNYNTFTLKKDNRYILNKDTIINENYLRNGDVIRVEYPDATELNKAKEKLSNLLNSDEIIYFHWSKENISNYYNLLK